MKDSVRQCDSVQQCDSVRQCDNADGASYVSRGRVFVDDVLLEDALLQLALHGLQLQELVLLHAVLSRDGVHPAHLVEQLLFLQVDVLQPLLLR